MRIQKITFWITLLIMLLSMIVSISFEYCSVMKQSVYQNLALAFFSASCVACLLAFVYYRMEVAKVTNKYFHLLVFLYSKILNVDIAISESVKQQPSNEIIKDKFLSRIGNYARKDIENTISQLRKLDYSPLLPNNTAKALNSVQTILSSINNFGFDLSNIEILQKEVEINNIEKRLTNDQAQYDATMSALLERNEALLSNLKHESEVLLLAIEPCLNVFIEENYTKSSWNFLKEELISQSQHFVSNAMNNSKD